MSESNALLFDLLDFLLGLSLSSRVLLGDLLDKKSVDSLTRIDAPSMAHRLQCLLVIGLMEVDVPLAVDVEVVKLLVHEGVQVVEARRLQVPKVADLQLQSLLSLFFVHTVATETSE